MSSLFTQACECCVHATSGEAADKERTYVWAVIMLARPRARKSNVSDPETSGFLLASTRLYKLIGKGVKISAPCLVFAKLIATYRQRERGSLCLQLYTHWWPRQFPVDIPHSMTSEMAPVTLNGSQNQTKSHKSGKGTGRQLGLIEEGGRQMVRRSLHYRHAKNCQRTNLIFK